MTYDNFISQFEILDNPPVKDGFHRHHIVPKSQQTQPDERCVYLSIPQHMWAHILYDRENGTKTAKRFLTLCNKPIEYFDCLEKCIAFCYTLKKKESERIRKTVSKTKGKAFTEEHRKNLSESKKGKISPLRGKPFSEEHKRNISESMKGEKNHMYGKHLSEEQRKKHSDSMKGKNTWAKGRYWFNNGIISTQANECPEGFVPGRLSFKKSHGQAS